MFLSDDLRQQILAYIPRYPSKQAVTLPALHIVHDALRCVPHEAIREIAELLESLCQKLHVPPGGTTADGKITLEFAECLGACEGAPAVMVNDVHRHNVTQERVGELVAESRQ